MQLRDFLTPGAVTDRLSLQLEHLRLDSRTHDSLLVASFTAARSAWPWSPFVGRVGMTGSLQSS
jgi:hypothetical protein